MPSEGRELKTGFTQKFYRIPRARRHGDRRGRWPGGTPGSLQFSWNQRGYLQARFTHEPDQAGGSLRVRVKSRQQLRGSFPATPRLQLNSLGPIISQN